MDALNKSNYLDSVFKSLETASSDNPNIFYDSLANNPFLKKPIIGSLVLQSKDIPANTSSIMRQGSSPAMSALGLTTAFNTFQGIFTLEQACHAYKAADRMHDETGKKISTADGVSRVAQIFGGLSFCLVRFADIANRGFNSLKMLAIPAAYSFIIGIHSFAVLYLGLAVLSVVSIKETNGFLKKAQRTSGNIDELKSVMGELTGRGTPILSKPVSDKDIYVHLGLELRSMLREIDPKLGLKLSDKKLGKALFKEKYNKFLPTVLTRMGANLESKGLNVEKLKSNQGLVQTMWAREKQVTYERLFGFEGMQLVQKAKKMHLYELLSNEKTKEYAEKTSENLLKELAVCSKKQRQIMIAYLITGVIGVVFTVLSDVFLAPLDVLICNIGFFTCYLVMGYADLRCFLESYKAGGAIGEYAKPYVLFHFALGLAAITTAAVLTSVTFGGFPVICLFVIGAVWMATSVGMLVLLDRREKKYDIDHPSLEKFLERLNQSKMGVVYKETIEIFHKLPKIQREAILKALIKNHKELKRYSKELKTFSIDSSLAKKSLEEKGRRLYLETKDQKIRDKAFELANGNLIGDGILLDEKSLTTHPCRDMFYREFYNELAKAEQQKFCERAGVEKIKDELEKLIKSAKIIKLESQKVVELVGKTAFHPR